MIRSQRILLAVGLPLLAVATHMTLCEWHYKAELFPGPARGILVYDHGPTTTPRKRVVSGLFAQGATNSVATLLGVVVPSALLGLTAFLLLGWHHQARLAKGLCPSCGYNLAASKLKTPHSCPECGWQRPDRS